MTVSVGSPGGRTKSVGGGRPIGSPHLTLSPSEPDSVAPVTAPVPTPIPNSVGAYYPWLDVLRGCSWILVMIAHSVPVAGVACVGRIGVGLFFATSGWLITKIIINQSDAKQSLATFYTRRCLRILPLYYTMIAVACLFTLTFPTWPKYFSFLPEPRPEPTMLAYLTTFSTEPWRGGEGGFLIGHCWSLCVEERFYVFWPLLLMLWPSSVNARRSLIVLMIVTWWTALRRLPVGDITTGQWALPFPLLMGCGLALFVPKARLSLPAWLTLPTAILLFAGYVAVAAHKEIKSPTMGTLSLLAGTFAVAIVACMIGTAGQPRSWLGRFLQECGKLSYAAYLFHPMFAYLSMDTATKVGIPWLAPFMGVAMVLPIAYASHRWIEKPMLNLRSSVEQYTWSRYVCALLQVAPVTIGLVSIFPWNDLGAKIRTLPNLMWIIGTIAVFAAAWRWLVVVMTHMAALKAAARNAIEAHRLASEPPANASQPRLV